MGVGVQAIMYCNGLAAYIFNGLLIYLILFYSRPELGAYRVLMVCFSTCNIIFPTIHMLVMPHLHVTGHSFIFFPEGILARWPVVAHWVDVGWGFMFGVILAVVMLHFIYRYLAVTRPALLIFFTSPAYVGVPILVTLFNGLVWGSSFHCSSYHIDAHKEYFRHSLWKSYGVSVDGLPMLGLLFVTNNTRGEEVYYWPEVFSGACCMILFFGTFSTITFCAVSIYRHLQRSDLMSTKTRRMQRELFRALVIQAAVPCMLEYGPCGFTHLLAFAGIDSFGSLTHYCIIFVSIYPAIDPLCVIYFIKDYRAAVCRKLGHDIQRSVNESTVRSQSAVVSNTVATNASAATIDPKRGHNRLAPIQSNGKPA